MRIALVVVLLCSLAGLAFAADALTLNPSVRFEFTDCASGGSVAQTLTVNSKYLMRVTTEDAFVCFASSASTCASGGEKFGAPFAMNIFITSDLKSVSCRSAGSTGDVIFTKVD